MPIESEYEPAVYNCDGSQTEFSFSFKIFETSELKVYKRDTTVEDPNVGQTLLTEGVDEDYTVSAPNNDYSEGGKVTTNEAYGSDYKIVITRDVAETQTGKFIENDNFPSAMNQNIVDKLCILVQERKAIEARLLKLAITSLYTNLTLPDPVADKILSWKDDLSGLKNIDVKTPSGSYTLTVFAETLFDDENAAAFLTTLGLDTDLLTLALPADTIISAFIKTLLDDADAATARATLGTVFTGLGQGVVVNGANIDVDGIVEVNGAELKCKVIEIGDWDMDAAAWITVEHGLTLANIRTVNVLIRNDDKDESNMLTGAANSDSGGVDGWTGLIDATNVTLWRLGAGEYDSVDYDDVGGAQETRGWITIWYEA